MSVTPHRKTVCELLRASKTHLSATELWQLARDNGASISLATIYNSLKYLVENGSVKEIRLADGGSLYDGREDSHSHLLCSKCGKLEDVELQGSVHEIEKGIEKKSNYSQIKAEIVFKGICPQCGQDEVVGN